MTNDEMVNELNEMACDALGQAQALAIKYLRSGDLEIKARAMRKLGEADAFETAAIRVRLG